MDRRTILAIVLSLGIYYAWIAWRGPLPESPEEVADATASAPSELTAPASAPATAELSAVPAAPVEQRTVPFHACGAEGKISWDGGRLHDLKLGGYTTSYDVMPLYTYVYKWVTGGVQGGWAPYGEPGPAYPLSDRALGVVAGSGDPLQTAQFPMQVTSAEGQGSNRVEALGITPQGIEVRKVFAEHREGDACWIDVEVRWTNQSPAPFAGDLWVSVQDHPHVAGQYDMQQPVAYVDGDLWYGGAYGAGWFGCSGTRLSESQRDVPLEGPVDWFGQSDRYFGFFLAPQEEGGTFGFLRQGTEDEEAIDGGVLTYAGSLQPGESRTQQFRAYAGPLVEKRLAAVNPQLPEAIDLGFWAFFGWPLLMMLRFFHGLLGNWGLAIIGLTVVIKVAFWPLTRTQFVQGERMKKLQPELNALKEKFADNPQELQRNQLELMTRNQVNPLGGCLPMLIQMPVWLALNQVLATSVDLHHGQFLYLRDLTSADPYLVLPVSITAMMWVQQQLTPATGLDPAQQQVMKYMPLIFGFMFFAFPSGLAVYVFVNMVLTIVQQWIIRRTHGSEPLPTAAVSG